MSIITLKKEKALIEDLDIGIGSGDGTRNGNKINAYNIPYNAQLSIGAELDTKESSIGSDVRYAFKQGQVDKTFNVANATSSTEAISLNQFNTTLSEYSVTSLIVAALAERAYSNGSTQQEFNVYNPEYIEGGDTPNPTNAITYVYMYNWFTNTVAPIIEDKANRAEVISKTVTPPTVWTPTLPWHPADLSYVQSVVNDIGAGDMNKATFVNPASSTEAVHTTNFIGSFGNPNGIVNANTSVMKLSQNVLVDANIIAGLGIGIFVGINILNGPPAGQDTPIAIEQVLTNSSVGQTCTTDAGHFSRYSYDDGSGLVWTAWSKTIRETDYSTTYAGGTIKMTITGTNCAITNNGTDAIIP